MFLRDETPTTIYIIYNGIVHPTKEEEFRSSSSTFYIYNNVADCCIHVHVAMKGV